MLMNSQQKHEENIENKPVDLQASLALGMDLKRKIASEIRYYKLLIALKKDDLNKLKCIAERDDCDNLMRQQAILEIRVIINDILIYRQQILAYENNIDKFKLIPDRLL